MPQQQFQYNWTPMYYSWLSVLENKTQYNWTPMYGVLGCPLCKIRILVCPCQQCCSEDSGTHYHQFQYPFELSQADMF